MATEELKAKIKEAVSSAISEVSCDTGLRHFNGNIHFSVDEGWTSVDVTELNE